eukprot:1159797-Pelagomonas_calceolata.AAC.4
MHIVRLLATGDDGQALRMCSQGPAEILMFASTPSRIERSNLSWFNQAYLHLHPPYLPSHHPSNTKVCCMTTSPEKQQAFFHISEPTDRDTCAHTHAHTHSAPAAPPAVAPPSAAACAGQRPLRGAVVLPATAAREGVRPDLAAAHKAHPPRNQHWHSAGCGGSPHTWYK